MAGLAIGPDNHARRPHGRRAHRGGDDPRTRLGPELVQREWADAWIWYLGPLAGGAAAALAYDLLYLRPTAPVPPGPVETGLDEPRPEDAAASP
ncbi:MAG: aquaporin [Thermoleophilia bacterium]|nr:aquaporin [Thermoleophilia bacterium]